MIVSTHAAFALSLELGLCVRILSTDGHEAAVGYGIGVKRDRAPDLVIVRRETDGTSVVEPLTPDGEAFLALVA